MALWWRPDGDLAPDVPRIRRIMPLLMGGKNESAVYFEQRVDMARTDPFLQDFRERTGLRATVLHLMIWAFAQTIGERPRLNRFVAGGRIWQRRGAWVSFSGKKAKSDKHPLVTVKLRVDSDWSLEEVVRRVDALVEDARSDRPSTTDKELKLLFTLPVWLLRLLVKLARVLDGFGLLPRAMIDSDPMFASIFIANLGSIQMDAGYHHLYEYGNIPIFMVAGQVTTDVVWRDGVAVARRVMPLKYTYDERVEDGLYCAKALDRFKARLEDPTAVLPAA